MFPSAILQGSLLLCSVYLMFLLYCALVTTSSLCGENLDQLAACLWCLHVFNIFGLLCVPYVFLLPNVPDLFCLARDYSLFCLPHASSVLCLPRFSSVYFQITFLCMFAKCFGYVLNLSMCSSCVLFTTCSYGSWCSLPPSWCALFATCSGWVLSLGYHIFLLRPTVFTSFFLCSVYHLSCFALFTLLLLCSVCHMLLLCSELI